jgi:hypothetical protein
METGNPDLMMVVLWLGSRMTGLIILILMIMWAFYNGQLKDMQRGRFIALDKAKVKSEPKPED